MRVFFVQTKITIGKKRREREGERDRERSGEREGERK